MININDYQSIHEVTSHFDYNIPYNTYPCTIPLDFDSVPLHWHEDAEFIYIKKGAGIIIIDGNENTVAAGDIAFILPGKVHGIYQLSDSSMEYENIIFDSKMFDFKWSIFGHERCSRFASVGGVFCHARHTASALRFIAYVPAMRRFLI